MIVTSVPFFIRSFQLNEQSMNAGGLPQWPAKSLILIGFVLLFWQGISELIKRIAKSLAILIVEHDMEVVMELAQRITVLHYGEVLAEGTPAEIQRNPRVLEVYLKI